jgi:hypothetical protein
MIFRGRRLRGRWNRRYMALFGYIVILPFAIVILLWAIGLWLRMPAIPN